MSIPGYDAWLTDDEPDLLCDECGSIVRHPGATLDLCSDCYDQRRAEARGED